MISINQQLNDNERNPDIVDKNVINIKEDGTINFDDSSEHSSELEDEIGEWMIDPTLPQTISENQQVRNTDGSFVLLDSEPSTFGDVCIKNSNNVHLGNKTLYKGPVTIKQFVYANPPLPCNPNCTNSTENQPKDAEKSDINKVSRWCLSRRYIKCMSIVALILVAGIFSILILLFQKTMREPDIHGITDPLFIGKVRFIERIEWGAQPPTEPIDKISLPVPYVIITHTATDFCFTQQQCTVHVRFAQMFHIEGRNWSDIGYNFLVGGDGLAYIGRSWDFVGAHSFGFNNISMGIAFIGTFNTVPPPQKQLNTAQKVIEAGIKMGKIAPNYKLLAHRQVINTLSPGTELYNIIKTWSHWSPTL